MEEIVLIGGGGHCRSCIDVLEHTGRYSIVGIVDLPEKQGREISGYSVFADDDQLPELVGHYRNFLVTVGQLPRPALRKQLFESVLALGGNLPHVVSPLAHVSANAVVGPGTVVLHHALVNAGARVGVNCIINSRVLVEHDVRVGDHCHVATAAVLNGGVVLGSESFLGSGTVVKQGVVIGSGCVVGMHVSVKRDISSGETVV